MLSGDGAALERRLHGVTHKHKEHRRAVQLLHTLYCLLQERERERENVSHSST